MGDVKGFIKYNRSEFVKEPINKRINHWQEFQQLFSEEELNPQAARCMDCGTPFCQSGCPINNIIPDWNDLVFKGKWKEAYLRLKRTSNFSEFTGRVCPAPCENSCVLAINNDAVTIRYIELTIIEKAYENGWIEPRIPQIRTNKNIAVIGSGPAGLACADQLNQYGHSVTVFEKNESPGGLLTYGIPNFKLDKKIVKRKIDLMIEEGIEFKTGINIGKDYSASNLINEYDAAVLACGAEHPRDLKIEGRDLEGIHFAMEFLSLQNKSILNENFNSSKIVNAQGKNVVVLGGGDTGSDCIGTSIRQGAKSVKNFELLQKPPSERSDDNPWPQWAFIERTSSSHEEGCERDFGILTKKFSGENGKITKLHAVRIEFGEVDPETGRKPMNEIEGSEFEVEAELVLLALGYLGPKKNGLIEELNLELNDRGNVKKDSKRMTNINGIFAAGDISRGQSLVVWAVKEGKNVAGKVDEFLKD